MKRCAIEGVVPYNRRALWRKREAPKPNPPELTKFSWTSSSLSNTSGSGVGHVLNANGDVAASV